MGSVWAVYGRYMGSMWAVYGQYMGSMGAVYGQCTGSVWAAGFSPCGRGSLTTGSLTLWERLYHHRLSHPEGEALSPQALSPCGRGSLTLWESSLEELKCARRYMGSVRAVYGQCMGSRLSHPVGELLGGAEVQGHGSIYREYMGGVRAVYGQCVGSVYLKQAFSPCGRAPWRS
jgi:hypothetical protein